MKKNNTQILFYTLAFGDKIFYEQAELLIVSLLSFKDDTVKIRIYTDNPSFFSFYQEFAALEICLITKEEIKNNSAAHYGYPFANKLNLINKVSHEAAYSASVFLDTDVVAIRSLNEFNKKLIEGSFFMYKKERCYSKESHKEYWQALNSIDLMTYVVNNNSSQWNSGIVAINTLASPRINDALSVMDNLLQFGVQQHTPEQVAISVVLEDTNNLNEAKDFFIHYHPNKKEWAKLAYELTNKRNEYQNLNDLINWYKSIKTYPLETPKQPVFYKKILFKWRNSFKKRYLKFKAKSKRK